MIGTKFLKRFSTNKDLYSLLQISKTANQEEIKTAYYTLAKRYHPDTNQGSDSHFKSINQAYSILGDPQKRFQYDSEQNP